MLIGLHMEMRVKNGKSSGILLVSCISFGKLNLFFRLASSHYSQEKKTPGEEKPTSAFMLMIIFFLNTLVSV